MPRIRTCGYQPQMTHLWCNPTPKTQGESWRKPQKDCKYQTPVPSYCLLGMTGEYNNGPLMRLPEQSQHKDTTRWHVSVDKAHPTWSHPYRWVKENQFLLETNSHIGCPVPSGQLWTHVYMNNTKCICLFQGKKRPWIWEELEDGGGGGQIGSDADTVLMYKVLKKKKKS